MRWNIWNISLFPREGKITILLWSGPQWARYLLTIKTQFSGDCWVPSAGLSVIRASLRVVCSSWVEKACGREATSVREKLSIPAGVIFCMKHEYLRQRRMPVNLLLDDGHCLSWMRYKILVLWNLMGYLYVCSGKTLPRSNNSEMLGSTGCWSRLIFLKWTLPVVRRTRDHWACSVFPLRFFCISPWLKSVLSSAHPLLSSRQTLICKDVF